MDFTARLWECVVTDQGWSDWLRELVDGFEGAGGTFGLIDAQEIRIDRLLGSWTAEPLADEYFQYWHSVDPQLHHAAALTRTASYIDTEHVDRGDARVGAYMAWQAGAGGYGHHLGGTVLLGDGRHRATFCVHRGLNDGPVPAAHRQRLDAALPAISRALELGFAQRDLLTDAFWKGAASDEMARAVVLLDDRGRLLRKTAAADALLSIGGVLRVVNGRLACSHPATQASLDAAVGAAIRAVDAVGGDLVVSRPPPQRPLLVVIAPLPWRSRMLAPAEAAAVVRIVDPVAGLRARANPLRNVFGLSDRESQFAVLLLGGHSAESAAAEMRIGLPTARTHLRNLFAKTRTSRQPELVLLLSRLADN